MLDRIIRLSISNPVFVNLLFFLTIAAGLRAAGGLPREQFPEIALDRVSITSVYPGATAQDVEELVTRPLEDALDDVADVKRVQSTSQEGRSSIFITFLEGKDLIEGRSEVEKAVSTVEDLPEDTETPIVRELKRELPVLSMALVGDRRDTQAVDRISDRLRDIRGVAGVKLSGLGERKLFVDIDEAELRALGLQPQVVVRAIQGAQASIPAGTVETRGEDVFVKTEKRLLAAADVTEIPLQPGSPLRIGDVAEVHDVIDDDDTLFFVNDQPAVKLTVGREEGADPLAIYEEIVELLPALETEVPPGVSLVITDDFTLIIRDRLDTVLWNALSGAGLVLLVLLLLSGFRQAMLALWGMPVSYFVALFLMGYTDITVNVISTFGLLIATGIIVDDAVVVIENVQRHLEMGKPRNQAVIEGTKEVLLPVTVAVLTTMLAFVPLTMVGGVMGRVLEILPLVVIFCLIGSLVEAIFILPGHMAHYASQDAKDSRTARLVRAMQRVYRPLLRWCIRHRYIAIVLVTLAAAGTGLIAKTLPVQIGAPGKPWELTVQYELSPGLDKAHTKAQGDAIAAIVHDELGPLVKSETHRIGSFLDRESGLTSTGANLGSLRWEFELGDELDARYAPMVRRLRQMLATDPDLGSFSVKETWAGPPRGAAVTARLRGRDIDDLNAALGDVKAFLYEQKGVSDIRDDYGSGKETFRVDVDPDRAALYGLTENEVGQAVRTAIGGVVASEVSIEEEAVDIVVRYAGGELRSRQSLADLLISNAAGQVVRLDQVGSVRRTREVGFVRREDGQRTVSALADADSEQTSAFGVAKDVQEHWDADLADRYPGVTLTFGGEADEITESLADLPGAFGLAVFMIFGVLSLQFKSFVQPVIILCAVPFGLMGAILGLWVMQYDLSLMALFGIVALVGIVVNDSLVMVDFVNKRMDAGLSAAEAAEDGALQRLRPIVSTTLTTCLGLLPLAIGLGGKDEILAPMAVSISAGLGFATTLVLLIVPAAYMVFDDFRAWTTRVRDRVRRRVGHKPSSPE